jgi:D-lactate dehydrogenase (cytochrome)
LQVSRVELLDEAMVKILNAANGGSIKETPILMFEFVGTGNFCHK